MVHTAAGIASMVFRQAVIKDTGSFSLDRRMLAVLIEFDGSRTVAQIARRLDVDSEAIFMTVRRLSKLGLIEPITGIARTLDPVVLNFLVQQLALAVGPVAVVLVEDEIQDLGYKADGFPVVRMKELIERLAATIRKDKHKRDFLKAVNDLIQMK